MSVESPVVKMKESRAKLLFLALKIVGGCGRETEAATRNKKIEPPEVVCNVGADEIY